MTLRHASKRRSSWRFWLGLLLSLGVLFWAVRALDWAQVIAALQGAHPGWIGLGVLTVLLTVLARAARWAALLHPHQPGRHNLLSALLIGQILNYFAPARAGDLARALLLGCSENESKAWALGTVALEKLWDVWALLVVVGWLSFSTALPSWVAWPAKTLALLSLLSALAAWLALRHRPYVVARLARLGRHLPPHLGGRLHQTLERLLDGLEGLRNPRAWFWTAVWSAATWGLGALTNYTVLMAMGLSLPFAASLLLLVVLQMGIALPSLPAKVGVFEGLCILVLALFAVDQDTAFAAGLALHGVVFVPPMAWGLYYFWRGGATAPHGKEAV